MLRLHSLTPLSVLLVAVSLTILGGCGDGKDVTRISIGTGGTGGVYYPFGGGLAQIWTDHVPEVKAVAEVTGASIENVKLADRGETVIGEIMGDVAFMAYHGEGAFQGQPQKIMAVAVMYPNVLHVVTLKDSGIESIQDLKGRSVSIGAPGSGTAIMTEQVLSALGLPQPTYDVSRLSFVESANALRDHSIQVGIWSVAAPTSSIMDLATTHDIAVVPLTAEEQRKVHAKYRCYSAHELPAGIYRGVDAPVPTLSVWNVLICQASLPEDLVFKLTRALFRHRESLEKIHPAARYTTPENTLEHCPIPLHPGAIRYMQELGLEVPGRLMPVPR